MPKRKDEFVQEYLYEELPMPLNPPIEKKQADCEDERGFTVVIEAFPNDDKEDRET